MVAAIRAAFHIALSKEDWHYPHCQEGKDNWCRYHQDRVNGTSTYKPEPDMPLEIVMKLKPIFAKLSDDSLLEKYLRDKTQN